MNHSRQGHMVISTVLRMINTKCSLLPHSCSNASTKYNRIILHFRYSNQTLDDGRGICPVQFFFKHMQSQINMFKCSWSTYCIPFSLYGVLIPGIPGVNLPKTCRQQPNYIWHTNTTTLHDWPSYMYMLKANSAVDPSYIMMHVLLEGGSLRIGGVPSKAWTYASMMDSCGFITIKKLFKR